MSQNSRLNPDQRAGIGRWLDAVRHMAGDGLADAASNSLEAFLDIAEDITDWTTEQVVRAAFPDDDDDDDGNAPASPATDATTSAAAPTLRAARADDPPWLRTLDALWAAVIGQQPAARGALFRDMTIDVFIAAIGDVGPSADLRNGRPIEKVIHGSGAVARFRLDIHDGPWTGLLAKGATSHGLLRVSNAVPKSSRDLVPAVALKFPINGHNSANLHFVSEIQTDTPITIDTFLSQPLKTWVDLPDGQVFNALRDLFWLATEARVEVARAAGEGFSQRQLAQAIAVAPLCRVTQDGQQLEPTFPDGVVLEPTDALRAAWAAATADALADRLAEIHLDEAAFIVLAKPPPQASPDPVEIGWIFLESPLVPGSFGDAVLRFAHPHELAPLSVFRR